MDIELRLLYRESNRCRRDFREAGMTGSGRIQTIAELNRNGSPEQHDPFRTRRISETALPRRKIRASWPASASAFACRNGHAALVGSSQPQALFTGILVS